MRFQAFNKRVVRSCDIVLHFDLGLLSLMGLLDCVVNSGLVVVSVPQLISLFDPLGLAAVLASVVFIIRVLRFYLQELEHSFEEISEQLQVDKDEERVANIAQHLRVCHKLVKHKLVVGHQHQVHFVKSSFPSQRSSVRHLI